MSYYLVFQTHYGADYKWIFDEETISKEVYGGGLVPNEDYASYWPIGGSNCSDSRIIKANNEDEIRQFLMAPPYGPDSEDPMLIDLSEYYSTLDCDYGSCTEEFLDKFGITKRYSGAKDFEVAEQMISALQKAGYADFDYDNPFCGENRDMRYSELCDLYEEVCGNDQW